MSIVVTAKLICVFVFAYAKNWFSHDEAHLRIELTILRLHRVMKIIILVKLMSTSLDATSKL